MTIIIGTDYAIQIDKDHKAYDELMNKSDNMSRKELQEFCKENKINYKELE